MTPPNACRFVGQRGHVESYFLRANDPTRPRALWIKLTVLAPLEGEPLVETWLVAFDGERSATFAHRQRQPFRDARIQGVELRANGWDVDLSTGGHARGAAGAANFDLRWQPASARGAEPFWLFGSAALREGPFPRFKLVTPLPHLRFAGALELHGERIELDGWTGMQGHNWGNEHAVEYAWGQCVFEEAPVTLVEAFTARVHIAGITTPRVSALVVRRGDREFRFDRLADLWRQRPTLATDRWTLEMSGRDGMARLELDAAGRPIAQLAYPNPGGRTSYCLNSKLAAACLEVTPRDGAAFRCTSNSGALEFLRETPDPRFATT